MEALRRLPYAWLLAALALMAPLPAQAGAASLHTTVLYDGALGTLPDAQGMRFITNPPLLPAVTRTFADGATLLDSTPVRGEMAGYFGRADVVPALDRAAGYSVFVTVELLEEQHDTPDRAGLSLTVLSSDRLGIELAFWEDEVWAQEGGGGGQDALFTHAESAPFDPTAGPVGYELRVQGDEYTLLADGAPLLRGPLRDYTPFSGPIDPYETPNLIFLGDNSSSASARVRLSAVRISAGAWSVALPLIARGLA